MPSLSAWPPFRFRTLSQAISNIKFDKVIVWENGGSNGTGATAGFLQNMAKTLPPVLQIMENIGGVKMPDFFGKMVDTAADSEKVAANGHSPTAAVKTKLPTDEGSMPAKPA
ncbi:hypothetical protein V5E97_02685 [Singulisphaera sp. Ch08]|uniref:Flotillin C-terminal domain-containing protein n=1 Tax=Singulisphaera sp. Ch08 TaxID=3120278 RepID=A0AAU7CIV6_9BACT